MSAVQTESRVLDGGARLRKKTGEVLTRRPFQCMGYALACVGIIIFLGVSALSGVNRLDINEIQDAFCSQPLAGKAKQKESCSRLMDALLKNPTPAQAQRLREIVKETP